jgi:hypothetical protein
VARRRHPTVRCSNSCNQPQLKGRQYLHAAQRAHLAEIPSTLDGRSMALITTEARHPGRQLICEPDWVLQHIAHPLALLPVGPVFASAIARTAVFNELTQNATTLDARRLLLDQRFFAMLWRAALRNRDEARSTPAPPVSRSTQPNRLAGNTANVVTRQKGNAGT